jgi:hypothetical protein
MGSGSSGYEKILGLLHWGAGGEGSFGNTALY